MELRERFVHGLVVFVLADVDFSSEVLDNGPPELFEHELGASIWNN